MTQRSPPYRTQRRDKPMPDALDDTMLCLHNGILGVDIVRSLDAQGNSSLPAQSYPGDPKCKAVWRRRTTEGKHTNAGLTAAYWVRTIPHCHEGSKDEFSCPLCRTMATGWGVHMQSACIMLPLLCLWSLANVANRLAIQGYSIEWYSPAAFSTTKEDAKHAWGRIPDFLIESHDQWSPLSVCITWSGVVLRSKGSPLSTNDAIAISSECLNWAPGHHENMTTCCTQRALDRRTEPARMAHAQDRMEVLRNRCGIQLRWA